MTAVCHHLILPLLVTLWGHITYVTSTSKQRLTATIPGDIMIGALFSVHLAPGPKQAQTRTCGKIREQYGIQRVEAAFHTIDEINNDESVLPNITLGIEIRDSCWYSPIALEQSIEFIRDAIAMNDDVPIPPGANASFGGGEIASSNQDCLRPVKQVKNLVGVIGPGSSTVTIQVQNLLQLFSIPQIGYSATSRDLSDKSFYKYFLRVVPSDFYQAQVMVDLVRKHNWTYISAVHTDGNYGGSGMEAFVKLAYEAGICIATSDSVLSNAEDAAFDSIIKNLQKYSDVRVVACFCEGMTIRGLLKASRRQNVTGYFLFIGSDGWSDRTDVVQDYEEEAAGGISIRIHSPNVHGFDPYYFSLSPWTNKRNPWFQEFWEHRFNCSLTGHADDKRYNRTCTGKEKLSDKFKQDTKMAFIKKAIYTMAYGLHNMQRGLCAGKKGLCPYMLPINGSVFLQYLMNVSFHWENEIVNFDANGDPPGRYDIMNFQRLNATTYDYVLVGSWIQGQLMVSPRVQWQQGSDGPGPPESVCSKPCGKGKIKSIQAESVKCCWACVPCKENEFLLDEYTCEACRIGWWPNANLTDCYQIPVEYIKWTDTTAIVSLTIATLGLTATVAVVTVFVRHNNTPVVKASTRELSYIILAGMALCHVTTLPLLARPSMATCFLSRVLPGFSFAMMYSALVTKTLRIARILAGSKKKIITKKPRFMSATAQVVITWLLITMESGIIAAMLVLEPTDSMLAYPTLNRVRLICNTTPLGIIAPLGFDLFLIGMCTVYAVKTRNVPENFNEAKFIGFTMYTTLVIWAAFVPIYFGSSSSKVITMCLCISFSAIVALVLLFLPKVYIILFRPDKNNRSAFTTAKDVRCHIGFVTSAVSRSSSHSTSDFSVESPRDPSVEFPKNLDISHSKAESQRRQSGNLFDRFRLTKQDKLAASIAQRIRAIREAEALDRKTHLRRSDSFHYPDLPRTPGHRPMTVGDGGQSRQEKCHLLGILKSAYGSDAESIPGLEALRTALPILTRKDVASQTDDDLLESLVFRLRRRVVRSETMISMLTPEEEKNGGVPLPHIRPTTLALTEGAPCHHQSPSSSLGSNTPQWVIYRQSPQGAPTDFLQSLYRDAKTKKLSSSLHSPATDRVNERRLMREAQSFDSGNKPGAKMKMRTKSFEAPTVSTQKPTKSHFSPEDATSPDEIELPCNEVVSPATGGGEARSDSRARSEDSICDATSSIIEESASSGSDDSDAVYKHIIISLGAQTPPAGCSRTPGLNSSQDSHQQKFHASRTTTSLHSLDAKTKPRVGSKSCDRIDLRWGARELGVDTTRWKHQSSDHTISRSHEGQLNI